MGVTQAEDRAEVGVQRWRRGETWQMQLLVGLIPVVMVGGGVELGVGEGEDGDGAGKGMASCPHVSRTSVDPGSGITGVSTLMPAGAPTLYVTWKMAKPQHAPHHSLSQPWSTPPTHPSR